MASFHENLIRVGMTLGFWLSLAIVAVADMRVAVASGVFVTLLTVAFIAWEVRKHPASDVPTDETEVPG